MTTLSEGPPRLRRRVEPNPDISVQLSSIPAVQNLIRQNNSETKPKYRLKVRDFYNHAFVTLGRQALEEDSLYSTLVAFSVELAARHGFMPANTAVSKVFHLWREANRIEEGVRLVSQMVRLKSSVSAECFEQCFEERTITVALRMCVKSKDEEVKVHLVRTLLDLLPPEKYKRRMFSPLIEHAMEKGDVKEGLEFMKLAVERGIELWDKEYNCLLRTVEASLAADPSTLNAAQESVEQILRVMEEHHPVVGSKNAEIIKSVLCGQTVSISASGTCSYCECALSSFELSDDQRGVLMKDLLEKLITPKLEGALEKEAVAPLGKEEIEERWRVFQTFKSTLEGMDYDTLVDGANVGYYGLNNWYKEAKEELLQSRGMDPSTVPAREREEVPFPVDVSPKFSIIEDMRRRALHQQRKPLIVLHQRHLDNATSGCNKEILAQWREAKSVIASPPFLNDDFCWLYAALMKTSAYIITNDQMRDHHFTMLSPRFFLRWRQRHRITFRALYHRASASVVLNLKTPRPYSVWVQKCVNTLGCRSSEGCAIHHWHIPFVESIDVIDQASNRVQPTTADVELSKDGDDECSSWLCTK